MKYIFILTLCINILFSQTLTMGYRLTERLPLIGKVGDNSGIYYDLFSSATKKMNVNLKIIRLPKKRIINSLRDGSIDFYPGFIFTEERTAYVYYLKNGLSDGGEVGISLHSLPYITNFKQLENKRVLMAFGGAGKDLVSGVKGVKVKEVSGLTIEKAIKLIELKRHDFYIYNKSSIEYYIKKNNLKNIKIHYACCGGEKPMYLSFSRESSYFREIVNLNFDYKKAISMKNLPNVIDKNSLAYKLSYTLEEMKKSGEIEKILNKYYKKP